MRSSLLIAALTLAGALTGYGQSYLFTPLAGVSSYGSTDGVGGEARFAFPRDVAVDRDGNVFVADTRNHTIRKITASGVVTTVAGVAGEPGSADGMGSAARFKEPRGIALDSAGTLYIAEGNLTIRKLSPAGSVTTLAGMTNQWGSVDGIGSAARFTALSDVVVDRLGNVFAADETSGTIRKITPAGEVTTFAGTSRGLGVSTDFAILDGIGTAARFSSPRQLAIDNEDNIYVADSPHGGIRKLTPSGVVTTLKTELWPWTIAIDQGNNVYVTTVDQWDAAFLGILYRITPSGAVSELAGTASGIGHEDGIGNAARFASPTGLATDPTGNIFVADTSNNAIRKVTPAGVVTTFAGLAPRIVDGANGRFRSPTGMAVDRDGNVYVIDDYRAVRKVTAGGVVTTLAGSPDERSPSDGVGVDARFSFIRDLAVDEVGNVFVADSGHRTIRRISAQGIVTTIAGSAFRSGYVDANGTAAQFSFPQNLAVDRAGNIYVADLNALRKISPNGDVSTVAGVVGQRGTTDGVGSAARFGDSLDLVVDGQGNILASDYANSTIRRITPEGIVTTIAGAPGRTGTVIDGPAESARFFYPRHMAIDSAGSVFVVDTNNQAIRKFSNGVVTTVTTSLSSIGPETELAVDAVGNLYISDTLRQTILKGVRDTSMDSGTRLTNLSVRVSLRAQEPLVAGFNVRSSNPVLLRGVGPGLQSFLPDITLAADPRLEIYDGLGTLVASNDNWGGGAELINAFASAGAFPFSIGSADAAMLPIVRGSSSVHFVAPTDGVGLIELFDLGSGAATGLVNLSARHRVSRGDDSSLVAGFTIVGSTEKTVLIRGIGPGLRRAPFNLTDTLPDPTITIYDQAGRTFATNDDSPPILVQVYERVGAFPLAAGSKDAALMLTMQPGVYSVALSSADSSSGEAMIEIYEVR